MSRRRLVQLTAVGVLAAVTAIYAATGLLLTSSTPLPRVTHVEAQPVLPGGEHRFGDLIEGRLDILVPLDTVDPRAVSTTVDFAPYRLVGRVRVERLRAGATGRVRYRFALDCLESDACVPRQDRAGFTFAPSRVRYETRAGATRYLTVRWPILPVRPRPRRDLFTPWEDGLRPLPAPGYRAPPHVVAVLAALLSLLALGGAAALLRPLLRRPSSPGERPATALEWALAAVRAAAARRDVDERRRALDLLSRAALAVEERRSAEARRLAWSQAVPHRRAMNELADRVERE